MFAGINLEMDMWHDGRHKWWRELNLNEECDHISIRVDLAKDG